MIWGSKACDLSIITTNGILLMGRVMARGRPAVWRSDDRLCGLEGLISVLNTTPTRQAAKVRLAYLAGLPLAIIGFRISVKPSWAT